jgi:hypothetical protein
MLNESQIGEVWMLFADYIEKKQIDVVAERYVELLADFGVRDRVLHNTIGTDAVLDQAITYYLDNDEDIDEDDDYKELDF